MVKDRPFIRRHKSVTWFNKKFLLVLVNIVKVVSKAETLLKQINNISLKYIDIYKENNLEISNLKTLNLNKRKNNVLNSITWSSPAAPGFPCCFHMYDSAI